MRDKLLYLLRRLGNALATYSQPAFNAYLHASVVVYMIIIAVVIGMVFIAADNEATMFPNAPRTHTLLQVKQATLAVYPLVGIALGVVLRWYELNKRHESVWRLHWKDIAKVGILLGGLASAKLAGIIAIVREMASAANVIDPESVFLVAMIPVIVIALVTYITSREIIIRE